VEFTWDKEKAERNLLKHDVSFKTAIEVFRDPGQFVAPNYFIDGEQREAIIGMTGKGLLVLVIFVDRTDDDRPLIRIISARKAINYEKRLYIEANS
jgi:uncharacterized DUF497 family protein